MLEAVAYPFREAQLSEPEPLLAQLPAMPRSFGYARALLDAHHVVEAVALEPGDGQPNEPGWPNRARTWGTKASCTWRASTLSLAVLGAATHRSLGVG